MWITVFKCIHNSHTYLYFNWESLYRYIFMYICIWIYFGQLCVKSSSWPFALNNSPVSGGFSETEIAIYLMRCMKQFEAFIPLHWKWRFTILAFSRHLRGVKLCPSITNSSSFLSLSFSIFKSHFKYSTKYLASLGIKTANLYSFFSPPLHGNNNTCLNHKDIVRHNIL